MIRFTVSLFTPDLDGSRLFNPYFECGPLEICADRDGMRISWWPAASIWTGDEAKTQRGWTIGYIRGAGFDMQRLPL